MTRKDCQLSLDQRAKAVGRSHGLLTLAIENLRQSPFIKNHSYSSLKLTSALLIA